MLRWLPAGAVAGTGVVVLGMLVVLRRNLAVVTVAGTSMRPAFGPGDRVMVSRRGQGRLVQGDVVVFREPHPVAGWDGMPPAGAGAGVAQWVIKRIVALPGDSVPGPVLAAVSGVAVVPPGMIVALGDNRAGSGDSRQWGFIPADQVFGRVARRLPSQGGATAKDA